MKIEINLKGRIPSKKNSKFMIYAKGRPMFIPSPSYKNWHDEQMWFLKKEKPISNIKKMELHFRAPDNRKTDLSNKCESVMDLLVDSKIIQDDNWFEIPEILMKLHIVDKNNPGVHIIIESEAPG